MRDRTRDESLASLINDAAARTSPWSPSSNKVFISDVYETIDRDGKTDGITLAEFRDMVAGLVPTGLVTVSRADLVAAMPSRKVAASETNDRGSTIHFVIPMVKNPYRDSDKHKAWKDEIAAYKKAKNDRRYHIHSLMEYGGTRFTNDDMEEFSAAAIRGIQGGRPMMAIISGETADRDAGKYRVTFFGEDGPHGHSTRKDTYDIADEIADRFSEPIDAMKEQEVIAWTQQPTFVQGALVVAFVQADNELRWRSGQLGKSDWARDVVASANVVGTRDGTVNTRGTPFDEAALEKAVSMLHVAIRMLPEQNPRIAGLVPNPPWVTSALVKSYSLIDDMAPAAWMPQLANIRKSRGNTIVGKFAEFGCGTYGCVLPTNDPKIVLKVTTDETEAEFASELANHLVADICVKYEMVMKLAQTHEKRPIYLLWRESVDHVGDVDEQLGSAAGDLIEDQYAFGRSAYHALAIGESPDTVALAISAWLGSLERIARGPVRELRPLARGIIDVYEQQRVLFGDLHVGNFGVVERNGKRIWVISDPGNVAVLED